MMNRTMFFVLALGLLLSTPVRAATYYVATNGSDAAAGTNWLTAKQTIQAGIDAASGGDTVLVSNGVYATGGRAVAGQTLANRIVITNSISLFSVNGPSNTVIVGQNPNGATAMRCAYISAGGTISGFTLTNGATLTTGDAVTNRSGGGVYADTSSLITNCIVTGNACDQNGGGVYGGTIFNSWILWNVGYFGGGAANSTGYNCFVSRNTGTEGGGLSGGVFFNSRITLNVSGNNCGGAAGSSLFNCLIEANSAPWYGGGAGWCSLVNCTVVGNTNLLSDTRCAGGVNNGSAVNCIIVSNKAASSSVPNYTTSSPNPTPMTYSCSWPLPGGVGNISNNPQFVDFASGDYGLKTNSPCINTGTNQTWMTNAFDLAGNPRIHGAAVDMGAYEYTPPSSNASFLLTVNCSLGGSVAPTGGTYEANSNVQIVATASNGYYFINWTGDVTSADSTTNVLMSTNRTVWANFAFDQHTVTVGTIYGVAVPGTVVTNYGGTVSEAVGGSPVANGSYTQYVSTGWTMTGNEPQSGSGTNFTTTLTNNAVLTWQWKTQVQFTASAGANGSVSGSANGWYDMGGSVTVTATPDAHYHFLGWSGNVSGNTNASVMNLTIDRALIIQANFARNQQSMTVETTHGLATPGSLTVDYGSSVEQSIEGSPVAGGSLTQYVCTGWTMTGNEPQNGTATNFTTTLTNDAVLTWLWKTQVQFTASAGANGTVSGATNAGYDMGGSVTVTASPDAHYHFVGWSGDVSGDTNAASMTLSLDQARSVTAHFAIDQHTLSGGTAFGTANPGSMVVDYNSSVEQSVSGSPVMHGSFTQFICIGWVMEGNEPQIGTTTNFTTTLTNNASLTWLWRTQVQVAASAVAHGTVSGSANGWYDLGGSVTVTATPDAHYHFAGWSGDVSGDTNALVMTLPMDRARSVTAHFAIDQHTMAVGTSYGIATPGDVTVDYGSSVGQSVGGSPITDGLTQYVCMGWAMTGNEPQSGTTTNFTTTLTNNAVLTWLWKTQVQFTVTAGANGLVSGSASGWYDLGGGVTVTAVPNEHYHFMGWSGDVSGDTNALAMTLTLDNARSVTANFAIDQHTLTVGTPYGSAVPGTETADYNAALNQRVSGSPVADGAATQYVCTGASVTGNGFTQVNPTNVTLLLTNDATLVWQWKTQVQFTATAGANGAVSGSASGWYDLGGGVTVTAVPDAHYHFAGWSGDVSGDTNAAAMTLTLDNARSVTANFAIDQHTLTVGTAYGTATPSGATAYDYGTILTNSVGGSPVINGTTQYVNTGWAMTGNEPGSGSGASLTMTLTNDATLTWLWITNFSFASAAGAHGVVTGSANGWYAQGASVSVTATPDWHYAFAGWSGEVSGDTNNPVLSMTMDRPRSVTANFAFSTDRAWTNYVAQAGGHVAPFETWSKAATNIQAAIDAAFSGDVVFVTNGTYNTGSRQVESLGYSRVVVDKALTVRSVNGPSNTIIAGSQATGGGVGTNAIRCAYLTNNASLIGFTLTNGYTMASGSGGGVYCESVNILVSNCVIIGNVAVLEGGGGLNGTFENCAFQANYVTRYGGGLCRGFAHNCLITLNAASPNHSTGVGGGVFASGLSNCIVSYNTARDGSGMGGNSTSYNCMVIGNGSITRAGIGGGACNGTHYNGTFYGNYSGDGGGVFGDAQLFNSIVVSNRAYAYGGVNDVHVSLPAYFTCASTLLSGVGNMAADPRFVNAAAGDFRLKTNSPCINKGTNQAWMAGSVDLDGNARLFRRIVDMGAYESQYIPVWTIQAEDNAHGSVVPSGAIPVVDGSGVTFQVDADMYYHLTALQTNSGLMALTNTASMTVLWTNITSNGRFTVGIDADLTVSNTPLWWLAEHGWTNDFDVAAMNDADGDTLPTWLEYRGKTDPTDSNSWLAVYGVSNSLAGTTGLVVRWYSVEGKNYFIDRTTNLLPPTGFQNIKSNITGTLGYMSYMDTNAPVGGLLFYRVGVE